MSGDIIDQAQEAEDAFFRQALTAKKPTGPVATGFCYNCNAALKDQYARWCDLECREDWEKRET